MGLSSPVVPLPQLPPKYRFPYSPLREGDVVVGHSGLFSICQQVMPAGTKMAVVNARTAFTAGLDRVDVELLEPMTATILCKRDRETITPHPIGHRTLMSDVPAELFGAKQFLTQARRGRQSRVLIGGLGLGVAARLVAAGRQVSHVDVVEIERDVVTLSGQNLPQKVRLHVGDLFDFIDGLSSWDYGTAFLDIWYGTGEATWNDTVAPLRRLIGNRFGYPAQRSTFCWAEPEMLGQVRRSIISCVASGVDPDACWGPAQKAFRRASLDMYESSYPVVPQRNTQTEQHEEWAKAMERNLALMRGADPRLNRLVTLFLHNIGSSQWEEVFGKHWPRERPENENG